MHPIWLLSQTEVTGGLIHSMLPKIGRRVMALATVSRRPHPLPSHLNTARCRHSTGQPKFDRTINPIPNLTNLPSQIQVQLRLIHYPPVTYRIGVAFRVDE